MKKIFASLFAIMFIAASVSAVNLWFIWDANPESEMVTSYIIQQVKLPATNFVDVVTVIGTTNVGVVKNLKAGTYKFRIVAINGLGRSLPSTEVNYPTNTPTVVTNFQITVPR